MTPLSRLTPVLRRLLVALPVLALLPWRAAAAQDGGFMGSIDAGAGVIVNALSTVFFYDVMFWDAEHSLPLVVLWLVVGSIFLTLRMGFINLRAFKHAVNVTRGKYSDPSDAGEVSHFQALAAALSATVGLGNIAGVAIAVSIGGPPSG